MTLVPKYGMKKKEEISTLMLYAKSYDKENIIKVKFEVNNLLGNGENIGFAMYKDEGEEHFLIDI